MEGDAKVPGAAKVPLKKRPVALDAGLENQIPSSRVATLSDEVVEQAVERVQMALECLAQTENSAYMEVLLKAPALVETESDPIAFLRAEDYQVEASAQRLASYWEVRKKAFGANRFHRPLLDLSGNGALSREDMEFLSLGICCLLPKDAEGRQVVFIDLSRMEKKQRSDAKTSFSRCLLYLWTKAALNANSSICESVILLGLLNDGGGAIRFDRVSWELGVMEMIQNAVPFKLHALHLCCIPPPFTKQNFIETVLPQVVQVLGKGIGKYVKIHVEDSTSTLSLKLQTRGLRGEGLPSRLGGHWSDDNLDATIEVQGYKSSIEPLDTAKKSISKPARAEGAPAIMELNTRNNSSDGQSKPVHYVGSLLLMQLAEALHKIPDEEKQTYIDAIKLAPEVVEAEADPALFLRTEDNCIEKATRRIVTYWQVRKQVFGEKAFLPVLDLTGRGSLSAEAIEALKGGCGVRLPDHPEGRCVMCYDPSKIPAKFTVSHVRIQCQFYWLSKVALSTPRSQSDGIEILRIVRDTTLDHGAGLKKSIAALMHAMPTRIHRIHFCCIPPPGGRKYMLETFVPTFLQTLGGPKVSRAMIHISDSNGRLLSKLEALGFRKDDLPDSIGGSWTNAVLANLVEAAERARMLGNETRKPNFDATDKHYLEEQRRLSSVATLNSSTKGERQLTLKMPSADDCSRPSEEEPPKVSSLLLMQLAEELRKIPDEEKQAYIDAVKLAPEVVEAEADPTLFLRTEDNCVDKTVRRIIAYWQLRKQIFGDQAFLPALDLTGRGALSAEAIEALQFGCGVRLPDHPDGRCVICYDSSKIPAKFTKMDHVRVQCLFYWISKVALSTSRSQSDGIEIMRIVRDTVLNHGAPLKKAAAVLRHAMPARIHRFHFCCVLPTGDRKYMLETFVPTFLQLLGESTASCAMVHISDSNGSLLSKLEALGFERDSLPIEIGGSLPYESFLPRLVEENGTSQPILTSKAVESETRKCSMDASSDKHVANESKSSVSASCIVPRTKAQKRARKTPTIDCKRLPEEEPSKANHFLLMQLAEELRKISGEEKQAYVDAVKLASEVVQAEANPTLFLKTEDNSVDRAARRMILYWQIRRQLLGDRALLPVLDLTGRGALSAEVVGALKDGCGVRLPNHPEGRCVIFLDSSKLPSSLMKHHHFWLQWRQCIMYWITRTALWSTQPQSEGIDIVQIFKDTLIDGSAINTVSTFLMKAAPLRIHSFQFCCLPQDGVTKHFSDTFFPMLSLMIRNSLGDCAKVHVDDNNGSILSKMEALGFERGGLPVEIGGTWPNNGDFSSHCPRQRESVAPLANLLEAAEKARTLEKRKARKRNLDVIYARKRREREKEEERMLRLKCAEITALNTKLRHENSKFETMLIDAQVKVALLAECGLPVSSTTQPPNSVMQQTVRTVNRGDSNKSKAVLDSEAARIALLLNSVSTESQREVTDSGDQYLLAKLLAEQNQMTSIAATTGRQQALPSVAQLQSSPLTMVHTLRSNPFDTAVMRDVNRAQQASSSSNDSVPDSVLRLLISPAAEDSLLRYNHQSQMNFPSANSANAWHQPGLSDIVTPSTLLPQLASNHAQLPEAVAAGNQVSQDDVILQQMILLAMSQTAADKKAKSSDG